MKYDEFLAAARSRNSYTSGKAQVLRAGSRYLRNVAITIGATAVDVKPNPGGIGVSGDLRLMMMIGDTGLHFFGNADFGYTVRSISSMTDYTGGPNRPLGFLPATEESFIRALRDVLPAIDPAEQGVL